VFVVVEKANDMTTTHYQIEVATKLGVQPVPPFIPFPPVFEKSFKTKRWFHTKCAPRAYLSKTNQRMYELLISLLVLNLETSALCFAKAFVRQRLSARATALQVLVSELQRLSEAANESNSREGSKS